MSRILIMFSLCLISFIFSGKIPPGFEKLINCINEQELSDTTKIDNFNRLIANYRNADFSEIQNALQSIKDQVAPCFAQSNLIRTFFDMDNEKNYNKIFEERYNWTNYSNCIKNEILNNEYMHELDQLLNFIKEKKFVEATREEHKLRVNGNEIIDKCSSLK